MKRSKEKLTKKIKTKGLVIPTDWDEKGNVSGVVISTYDEKEYTVKLNQKGRELLSLIREPVKIRGLLRMSKTYEILDVEEYNIIEQ